MTDSTGLTGVAAAVNVHEDVEFINCIGSSKGLTNGNLKGFKAEILVNASLVDGEVACSGYQIYSGY